MQALLNQKHQDMFKQARSIAEHSTGTRICPPVRFSHTALQVDPDHGGEMMIPRWTLNVSSFSRRQLMSLWKLCLYTQYVNQSAKPPCGS